MEVKSIMKEIQHLPLSDKFIIMEQTLKAIKKEEFKEVGDVFENEPKTKFFSYLASQQSLANDWLSEEDDRWDTLL